MCLGKSDGVFAFAAAEFQHYGVVVTEILMPMPFHREPLLFDTLKRVLKEVFKSLAFGETLEFVLLSHDLITYATARRLRYIQS